MTKACSACGFCHAALQHQHVDILAERVPQCMCYWRYRHADLFAIAVPQIHIMQAPSESSISRYMACLEHGQHHFNLQATRENMLLRAEVEAEEQRKQRAVDLLLGVSKDQDDA